MRKIFAIALAALVLSVMTPATSAAESVSRAYSLAAGGGVEGLPEGAGMTAFIVCLGPPEQQICEENGIAPIGGFDGRRSGSDVLNNALVSANDDVFGSSDTYTEICVYSSDHSICSEEEGDVAGGGCGSYLLPIPTGVTSANQVAGFVYNLVITQDLRVCGGSSGIASVDYF